MAIKIYPDQIDFPVHQYIEKHTDAEKVYQQSCVDFMKQHNLSSNPTGMEFDLVDYDHDKLSNDTIKVVKTLGFKNWACTENKIMQYGGLSFVYDPYNETGTNKQSNTLGSPTTNIDKFFYGQTNTVKSTKHSYFDTYAFTEFSDTRNFGYIKEFLDDRSKRTLIRSRLAVFQAGPVDDVLNEGIWHKDEKIYLNLRINIPITTSDNFLFEMKNKEPYHLNLGKVYSWDTYVPHRVLKTSHSTTDRIHFVLGFSPWFDYDKENRCWVQNEFYGKHPFQMLIDGDVFGKMNLSKIH